ncbi:hypothetical protein GCK72_007888 [Caenorhabditis remanei]|uniref:F-box associated domain-containing protein n=1 Tax=Caenorhabditis remanei TaxID=31234 RepID=A0A6A5HJ83_CAERE|nr:hypothetical protein GCK72_007888 [Caenorhabditis remanei]KAF1767928.1 hypothetical protein GCK72_007888 [Caenorhabditis remanei]
MPLPLSYPGLKCVLENLEAVKRQELLYHLPSIRTINSLLPYTIEFVRIMPNSIKINKKLWVFGLNHPMTATIFDSDSGKHTPILRVNKSTDEAIEKFFNVYLKNGSNIQDLELYDVPKFLCETDRSNGLKLNISRIWMKASLDTKFNYFTRYINLDKLEYIYLSFTQSSEGEFRMLTKPVIINCKGLDLVISASRSLINYYTGLRNQSLVLYDDNFQVNELRLLIENWKTSDRLIGTSFCLYSSIYDTNEVINSLDLRDTFPVEIQRDSTDYPGIGIKIDGNRDLVLYYGKHPIGGWYHPALKMEVIARGSLKKIGDCKPDLSA